MPTQTPRRPAPEAATTPRPLHTPIYERISHSMQVLPEECSKVVGQ
jgi:hypothetical protein